MAQAPVMPVFTDALIGDTQHLSPEQFGAYFRILIVTWRNNGVALPDDDKRMARICKVTIARWRKEIRPVIEEFFTINSTGWHQKRLEKEWKKFKNWRENASKGGKAKALKTKKTTPAKSGAKSLLSIIHKKESESLCVDSETPKPRPRTHARACARTHKKLSININGKDKDWHDQYIDIGRKAAFKVERT